MMELIKCIAKKIISFFSLLNVFFSDFFYYYKYSKNGISQNKKEQIETDLILICHSVEKGMTFEDKKKNWGKDKAFRIIMLIKEYISSFNEISDVCRWGINVLKKYTEDQFASKDDKLQDQVRELIAKYPEFIDEEMAGVKSISEPDAFNKDVIMHFFNSRSSIRNFSDKPILKTEIDEALKISHMTPTACNRQSSRVYCFQDKTIMKQIIDNQLGDQGWCEKANSLFIITAKQSNFGGIYERSQALIDGGLFAMNFVYGLHLNQIGSCFKMFVRIPKLQKQIYKICNIPVNEIPIVLILAGHYKDTPIKGPVSYRFKHKCIFR